MTLVPCKTVIYLLVTDNSVSIMTILFVLVDPLQEFNVLYSFHHGILNTRLSVAHPQRRCMGSLALEINFRPKISHCPVYQPVGLRGQMYM